MKPSSVSFLRCGILDLWSHSRVIADVCVVEHLAADRSSDNSTGTHTKTVKLEKNYAITAYSQLGWFCRTDTLHVNFSSKFIYLLTVFLFIKIIMK